MEDGGRGRLTAQFNQVNGLSDVSREGQGAPSTLSDAIRSLACFAIPLAST